VRWTRNVARAVERLLCKLKALSSNPSPTKKKKENVVYIFIMKCYLGICDKMDELGGYYAK
jgi:hypothetical protein